MGQGDRALKKDSFLSFDAVQLVPRNNKKMVTFTYSSSQGKSNPFPQQKCVRDNYSNISEVKLVSLEGTQTPSLHTKLDKSASNVSANITRMVHRRI